MILTQIYDLYVSFFSSSFFNTYFVYVYALAFLLLIFLVIRSICKIR